MDFPVVTEVCSSCFPNFDKNVARLTAHLVNKNGSWRGGWSKAKAKQMGEIHQAFRADKLAPVACLDGENGVNLCAKCLRELATKLEEV